MAIRMFPGLSWRHRKLLSGLLLVLSCLGIYLYLVPLQYKTGSPAPDFIYEETYSDTEGVLFDADNGKQAAIVEAFKSAWRAYERDALGCDEYHPISHKGSNISTSGGVGYTVTDALDTIIIMGLSEDLQRARDWVEKKLTFDRQGTFSTFEITIRVLGGLLSAYRLMSDDLYLERAIDLADRLLSAFDTPSGLPLPSVNLAERRGVPDEYSPRLISTAEAATLQLEFRYLSELTGNFEYWDKAERALSVIQEVKMSHNLVPINMNVITGEFITSDIRLGSRGDSYYEYLLKQYLQTNQSEEVFNKMYTGAMQGVHDNLVQKTPTKHLTYIAELIPQTGAGGKQKWRRQAKQDHLVCFLAGSLMLGATTSGAVTKPVSVPPRMEELSAKGQRDWKTGVELLETCMETHNTETGLSPEIAQFKTTDNQGPDSDRDWYIKNSRKGGPSSYDARYMLRPETVESLFIAWRLTGDARYRRYAWSIFSSIEKYCKVPSGGYATALDVDTVPVSLHDKQETFFLSETLKYLYLTFGNSSVLPLNEYVFNTEAHPLPIFKASTHPKYLV